MKKQTLNKDGTPRKSGSGRTKGAVSFTNVALSELKKFVGDATVIPVSRKWLENMGFNIQGANAPVVESKPKADSAPSEETPKISFKIHK